MLIRIAREFFLFCIVLMIKWFTQYHLSDIDLNEVCHNQCVNTALDCIQNCDSSNSQCISVCLREEGECYEGKMDNIKLERWNYPYCKVVHATLIAKVAVRNAIILFVNVPTKKKMISGTNVLTQMVPFWEDVLTIVKMTNRVKQFALLSSNKIRKSVHARSLVTPHNNHASGYYEAIILIFL